MHLPTIIHKDIYLLDSFELARNIQIWGSLPLLCSKFCNSEVGMGRVDTISVAKKDEQYDTKKSNKSRKQANLDIVWW
jgi:hypothetical protein